MTPTPNPTAQRLRELVANLVPLDLIHDRHRPEQPQDAFEAADRILAALRAHGLLSEGAPSEEQIEAAAREWYEQANGYETWASASGKHQQVVRIRAAKALAAAGVAPQGSAAAAAALCDEVITIYEGNVGTHGPECYRWHAGCLALKARQALGSAEFQGPVSARWLAAHDAEVAAKALEEAADLAEGVECIVLDPVMEKIGKNVGLSLAQEFRARAAEIREGKSE